VTEYHRSLGHHFAAEQASLDLAQAIEAGTPASPYRPPHLTEHSVRRFLDEVLG